MKVLDPIKIPLDCCLFEDIWQFYVSLIGILFGFLKVHDWMLFGSQGGWISWDLLQF